MNHNTNKTPYLVEILDCLSGQCADEEKIIITKGCSVGPTCTIRPDGQGDVADEVWTNEDESAEIEQQIVENNRL